jgi:hypothetical protein
MLNLRADLFVELADVLRTANQQRAAREAVDEATGLYERKGNIVAAGRVTRAAGNDPSPSASPKRARTMIFIGARSDSNREPGSRAIALTRLQKSAS